MVTPSRIKPNRRPAPGPIGNTTGIILPDTAPNPSGNSAPVIKPTEKEKGWWARWGSSAAHIGLDVVGLIPGVGEIADGANALIYLAEGDKVNAALSAAAMIPGAGMAATGAKWGKKAVGVAAEAGVKVAREGAEKGIKEGAEVAAKNNARKKGGKDKGKKKLECGDYGRFGDLKKKTGDNKFDRDHIPSKAALKERARELNGGRDLSKAQQSAIDKWGEAVAIPKQAHTDASPTYGQTAKEAARDAKNLHGSSRRDVEAMLKEIDKYDTDGKCKRKYQKAAGKLMRMTNKDFDKGLSEILKRIK